VPGPYSQITPDFADAEARAAREEQHFDVKRKAVECHVRDDGLDGVRAQHLESTLGVFDAWQRQDLNRGVERASERVPAPAFSSTFRAGRFARGNDVPR